MDEQQMCLSCSERPATTSNDTVPLCAQCAGLIKNPRGVEYEKAEEPTTPILDER